MLNNYVLDGGALVHASREHVDPHTRTSASCIPSMSQGSMERQLSCSTVIRAHPPKT